MLPAPGIGHRLTESYPHGAAATCVLQSDGLLPAATVHWAVPFQPPIGRALRSEEMRRFRELVPRMTLVRGSTGAQPQHVVGKLRPTYPRDRIARSIREAAAYGIALIVAAAGYGKTEALRHTYDSEAAIIVELDDRIATVEAFLKKLVRTAIPRHLRGFMALLEKTSSDEALTVLIPWVSSRLRGLESSLVIDDLHRLFRDPRAAASLQELIESTRHSATWVLSTRETPDLPIGTWIAREWMHRPITASDLAFREDEAAALAVGTTGLIDRFWPIGERGLHS